MCLGAVLLGPATPAAAFEMGFGAPDRGKIWERVRGRVCLPGLRLLLSSSGSRPSPNGRGVMRSRSKPAAVRARFRISPADLRRPDRRKLVSDIRQAVAVRLLGDA